MARKKDERAVKQAYKEERKAKAAQKKTAEGGASDGYLQPNDEHFISFKNQLATMGLMLRDVPGDGNCLFRALNDQMEGHSRNHLRLRQDTVRFMLDHRADFEPFVEDDVPFQTHVRLLSQPGTYGGHDALVAFARMRQATIVIHQLNSPLWQIEGGPTGCPQLHLSYHNGEHYSSVRRIGDTGECPANVRINITAADAARTSSDKVGKGSEARRRQHSDNDAVDSEIYCENVQKLAKRTGCQDLAMIREALADCDGDEDAAADYIASMILATVPENGDAAEASESATATSDTTADNTTAGSSTLPRVKNEQGSAKKLTNKQRKEQNRREKLEAQARRDQKSSENRQNANSPEAITIDAAFGCLRI